MLKTYSSLLFCLYIEVVSCHFSFNANINRIGETHWQLFNECSQGMLQSFLGSLNARGYPDRHCLTDWNVIGEWDGTFRLQHAQSRKYICFNKRARITLRYNGIDRKCVFMEEIGDNGYSRIRSSWKKDLYFGFNGRGRFQNPQSHLMKPRCFDWVKLVRYVPENELHRCDVKKPKPAPNLEHSSQLHSIMRSHILSQVSATHDSSYRSKSLHYSFQK